MEEEIDLTKAKWNLDEESYLQSIKESIIDNYPGVNIEEELKEINLSESDLLQTSKLNKFLNTLMLKFPDA